MARILVAYASKNHSTAEIAEAIAAELRAEGHEALAVDAAAADPTGYDAVVLGSAVYIGRWRREAERFLRRYRARLAQLPFWVFSSGPLPTPESRSADANAHGRDSAHGGERSDDRGSADAWLEPRKIVAAIESIGVREHVVFGGRVPMEATGFFERMAAKNADPDNSDLRDWDAIRDWSRGIATALSDDRLGS